MTEDKEEKELDIERTTISVSKELIQKYKVIRYSGESWDQFLKNIYPLVKNHRKENILKELKESEEEEG